MGIYEKIPERVEAYKWLGPDIPNEKQLPPQFIPDIEVLCRDNYYLETRTKIVPIQVGDYIVKDNKGYYSKFRDSEFLAQFNPVTNS